MNIYFPHPYTTVVLASESFANLAQGMLFADEACETNLSLKERKAAGRLDRNLIALFAAILPVVICQPAQYVREGLLWASADQWR